MSKVFSTNKDHNSSTPFRSYLSRHWEEIYFLILFFILSLQVLFLIADTKSILGSNGGAVAVFASFESFILTTASYITVPLFIVPLACLVAFHDRLMWARWY
jgi:hypothetical protein